MSSNRRLDGWQEIANYLQITIRAAQHREKEHSLPVHRPSSTKPGRRAIVFAYEEELDAWTRGTEKEPPAEPATSRRPSWRLLALAFVVPAGIFALLTLGWFLLQGPTDIAMIQTVHPNRLVAVDSSGKAQWDYVFKDAFDQYTPIMHPAMDFDEDGRNEVLFLFRPADESASHLSRLILFESDGAIRWEYSPGAEVVWGGRDFTATYSSKDVVVGTTQDGRKFVVLAANNKPSFPGQVSILDSQGRVVSEYWNTGYVFDCEVMDVDEDGTDEILLGGINSLSDVPFFAVISHDIGKAISPVEEGYAPGFAVGREQAYALLPRTDVAENIPADSRIWRIVLLEPSLIQLEVEIERQGEIQERVYSLDRDLNIVSLDFPASFERVHVELEREGLLDHAYNPELVRRELMEFSWLTAKR